MINRHVTLGEESFLNQYGAFIVLSREFSGAYDWLEWQILMRDLHDVGDLCVRRRDVCHRVGFDDMAEKWHKLSIDCADVVEDFGDCLDNLFPVIPEENRRAVWN